MKPPPIVVFKPCRKLKGIGMTFTPEPKLTICEAGYANGVPAARTAKVSKKAKITSEDYNGSWRI